MMSYQCAKRFKYSGEERENDNPNETISSIDDNPTSPVHKLAASSSPPLSSLTNKFPLHGSYQYPQYSYPYYGQDTGYNFNYYQQQQQQQYGQVFNPRVQANRNSMGSSGSDTSSTSLASPQADLAYAKSAGSKKRRPIPVENKDEAYWEKRRKNNESAKRSRDMRRSKEEHISVRVIYLEQENLQLKTELALMKTEAEKLRAMLYAASNSALVATNSVSAI